MTCKYTITLSDELLEKLKDLKPRQKTALLLSHGCFLCPACKEFRPIELQEKSHTRCIICGGYRNHKRKAKNPLSFGEFQEQFIERRNLSISGEFKCLGCNLILNKSLNHLNYGRCYPCYIENKRNNRMTAATNSGREFKSRALHSAHVEAFKMSYVLDGHVNLLNNPVKHDSHVRKYNGYKLSNEYKFFGMSDDEVKQYFEKIGEPWNNPRLSVAEKYNIKYHENKEFRAKELIKSRFKKKFKRRDIDGRLRSAIISQRKGSLRLSIFNILGYSKTELINSLEEKFTTGMTWEKFMNGEIHIDHVLPIDLYNLDTEIAMCWSLDNLQPLWAADNIAKSDRLPDGRLMRNLSDEDRIKARDMYLK